MRGAGTTININFTMLPRIAPFVLFMGFVGFEEAGRFLADKGLITISEHTCNYLYPVKTISVAFVLYWFRNRYYEIEVRQLFSLRDITVSAVCGIAVFVLWINMGTSLEASRGFNPMRFEKEAQIAMIVIRLVGAVLVVPVMEELFWRSFFIRYMVKQKFTTVPIGTFTWTSFVIASLLFGLEHDFILAGITAGIAYNLLLYYTRSIAHCIFAHSITNVLLGIYVLDTHRWYFW